MTTNGDCRAGKAWLGVLAICGWLWAAPASAAGKPVLRFIVGEDWASPYLEMRAGRPVGGLAFDLMEAVARAAGAEPEYLMLPPKRTQAALHAGEADLMCMMSPKWLAQPLGDDRIGPPMVVLEDVLAVAPGSDKARPLNLPAQRGLRVGTVLGYRYHELGPLFDEGRLVRDDAATQQGVLEKLARGRTGAAVVDRLVLAQYNRGRPPSDNLQALQVVSQTVTHACWAAAPTCRPGSCNGPCAAWLSAASSTAWCSATDRSVGPAQGRRMVSRSLMRTVLLGSLPMR